VFDRIGELRQQLRVSLDATEGLGPGSGGRLAVDKLRRGASPAMRPGRPAAMAPNIVGMTLWRLLALAGVGVAFGVCAAVFGSEGA